MTEYDTMQYTIISYTVLWRLLVEAGEERLVLQAPSVQSADTPEDLPDRLLRRYAHNTNNVNNDNNTNDNYNNNNNNHISLLRLSLLRFLDSTNPGNPLRIWKLDPWNLKSMIE